VFERGFGRALLATYDSSRSFVRVAGVDRKALPALPHQPLLEMPLCAGVEQAEENARKKRKRQADRESALLVANK